MYAHAGRLQFGGWRGIFLLLIMGGSGAAFLDVRFGSSGINQFSDTFPSGLCFSLDVFCGVALATGCLSIATIATIIGGHEWRLVVRAALLAGILGYLVAIFGSAANEVSAHNWRVWLGGWSSRVVFSGAIWTVALLGLLLFVEFFPECSLAGARSRSYAILGRLDLPLLIFATFLAALHQFGLAHLIRLAEGKLSPLWTGPSLLPLFYLSSLALGLAILLFASWRSCLAVRKALPEKIQPVMARLLTAVVFVYLAIRGVDLLERELAGSILSANREGFLVLLELVLLLCGMLWIHGSENAPRQVFIGSALVIAGVIANRLNTDITALEVGTGQAYLPRWGEFLIAYSLIAAGVAGFAIGVKHFSVFTDVDSAEA